MPQFSKLEQEKLKQLKDIVSSRLNEAPQFPEVVGDRKLMRFLRGHDYDIEKVSNMVKQYLDWRRDHNVDEIRQKIVLGGANKPCEFPKSDIILKLLPQAVILPNAKDIRKSPICVEKFDFSPSHVLENITIPEYITFLIYCLEYKSLITEQQSEEADQEYLNSLTLEEREKQLEYNSDLPPYGHLTGLCIIRDLNGLGFEHIGSQGQEILKTVVHLSSNNYPELLQKCYVINSPWIFNAMWFFLQGLLSARTVAKVMVMGTDYLDKIKPEIDENNIPSIVGGPYSVEEANHTPYPFNIAYLCPDMSAEDIAQKRTQLQDKIILDFKPVEKV